MLSHYKKKQLEFVASPFPTKKAGNIVIYRSPYKDLMAYLYILYIWLVAHFRIHLYFMYGYSLKFSSCIPLVTV